MNPVTVLDILCALQRIAEDHIETIEMDNQFAWHNADRIDAAAKIEVWRTVLDLAKHPCEIMGQAARIRRAEEEHQQDEAALLAIERGD